MLNIFLHTQGCNEDNAGPCDRNGESKGYCFHQLLGL